MSDDLFDIERLRKNWAPLPEETIPGLPPVLEQVGEAVPEPLETAHELLARMEQLARLRFPAHRDTLGSFFHQANTLLEQHRQGPVAPAKNPDAGQLGAVQATLDSLEELLEVFILSPRP